MGSLVTRLCCDKPHVVRKLDSVLVVLIYKNNLGTLAVPIVFISCLVESQALELYFSRSIAILESDGATQRSLGLGPRWPKHRLDPDH
jgi:hypothetical protein